MTSVENQFDHSFSNGRAYYSEMTPMQAMFASPELLSDDHWYTNSGATNHITHVANNLMQSAEFNGQHSVHIGDGTGLSIFICVSSLF